MSPDNENDKSTALSNNFDDPKNKNTNFTNFKCLQEDRERVKIAPKNTNLIEESKVKIESDYSEEKS